MATVGLYIFSFQQFAVPDHEIAGAIGGEFHYDGS